MVMLLVVFILVCDAPSVLQVKIVFEFSLLCFSSLWCTIHTWGRDSHGGGTVHTDIRLGKPSGSWGFCMDIVGMWCWLPIIGIGRLVFHHHCGIGLDNGHISAQRGRSTSWRSKSSLSQTSKLIIMKKNLCATLCHSMGRAQYLLLASVNPQTARWWCYQWSYWLFCCCCHSCNDTFNDYFVVVFGGVVGIGESPNFKIIMLSKIMIILAIVVVVVFVVIATFSVVAIVAMIL